MRKIFLIAGNGLVLTLRDRTALLFALLMPLILTAILGTALQGTMAGGKISPASVLVLNLDQGAPLSPSAALPALHFGDILAEDVLNSAEVRQVLTARGVSDLALARADVAAGRAAAAIYIPATFTADALAGRKADVIVYTDPGNPTRGAMATQVVRGFTDDLTARLLDARLAGPEAVPGAMRAVVPEIAEVASGAKPVSAMQYYAAAMALMFVVTTAIQRGGKLLEERERGTLQRMLISPTGKGEVVGGQILGTALLALAQCFVLMLGTRLLFRVDWGPWENAMLLGAVFALAASGIGVATAAVLKDRRAADIASGALGNLLGVLSGTLVPLYAYPDSFKLVAKFTPNYWALQGFLDQMAGLGGARVWLPAAILAATAAMTGGFGAWRLATK
ncbi:MAG TPA: ABC transporter permease [Symbiobacteriaceae bacterium]|jgi:ABC-2 type transport system permease protein